MDLTNSQGVKPGQYLTVYFSGNIPTCAVNLRAATDVV